MKCHACDGCGRTGEGRCYLCEGSGYIRVETKPVADGVAPQPSYQTLAQEIGKLVDEKNAAYGSAFDKAGQILEILYPDGIKVSQYRDVLATVRILDKLFRIASRSRKDAFGESPYRDIAGYGLLGAMADLKAKEGGDNG